MPNLREMDVCNAKIVEIDKAIRECSNFTDQKAYFNTEKGRELVSLVQLEKMRDEETAKLRMAGMQ